MASLDDLMQQLGPEAVKAEDITKVDRLKVAVCGQRKVGKSAMVARTARKPLLHYDFDDRRESIAGTPDTIIKTIYDRDTINPMAWSALESDIASMRYLKSQEKLGIRSICLDSMTYLRKFAENQMMKDTNLKRTRRINGHDMSIAQGWDSVTATRNMITTLMRDCFSLGIDVYAIWHIQPEKDKINSKKVTDNSGNVNEVTAYTGRYVIEPQYMEEVLSIFNEVWRCYIDAGGEFKVQVRPDEYFQAATALSHVEATETQDIQALLKKHGV